MALIYMVQKQITGNLIFILILFLNVIQQVFVWELIWEVQATKIQPMN